jgi:uncharacterized protein
LAPAFQLADIAASQLALVGVAAFTASIIGGLAGYGVGLILPVFLAPAIGIVNVIPVMSVATAITNASRIAAFWRDIDRRLAVRLLLACLPACLAGAYAFTLMNNQWIGMLIGGFLIISIPLRRYLERVRFRLDTGGIMAAGVGYGFLSGAATGTGLLLISILMAANVQGAALIGTDALVSVVMNLAKMAIFTGAQRVDAQIAVAGILVGLCTVPGAFTARWLLKHVSMRAHAVIMDAIILVGGAGFLWGSFR